MEAKDKAPAQNYLQKFKNEKINAIATPGSNRAVEYVVINEKDRHDVEAILKLYRDTAAVTRAKTKKKKKLDTHAPGDERPSGKVYAYGRTSNNRTSDGGSRERQTTEQQDIATRFNLGEILTYFHDDGFSGATLERPDWDMLEIELKRNPGSVLVVERIDRLFRTARTAGYIIQFLFDHNVDLYDQNGYVTEQRLMDEAARSTGAYFLLCQRSAIAIRRAQLRGVYTPAAPWGYFKKSRGVLVPDRELVDIVKRIFEMRASQMPVGTIRRWLEEQGVPNPSGGVHWHWNTLNRILKNYIYVGLTIYEVSQGEGEKEEPEPIVVPTPHTRIVDVKVFEAIQSLIESSRKPRKENETFKGESVLTRRTPCAECGRPLVTLRKFGNSDTILFCDPKRGGCGKAPLISKNAAEAEVYRALRTKLTDLAVKQAYTQRLDTAQCQRDKDNAAALAWLDRQIAERQERLDNQAAKAWQNDLQEEMAPFIRAEKEAIRELKAQRMRHVPADFVPQVVEGLRTIEGALQLMIDNVPFRGRDTKSESLIHSIRKVISAVMFERTDEGRIRQHTILDFNGLLGKSQVPNSDLIDTVVADYDPPILDDRVRRVKEIGEAIDRSCTRLSDDEFGILRDLPTVRKVYAGLSEVTLRAGFDALAVFIVADVNLSDCFRACGIDPYKGFAARFARHRQDYGVAELVECLRSLRPRASNVDALVGRANRDGRERQKFAEVDHPILEHRLCKEGGAETVMTDEEWACILKRMDGKQLFGPAKQDDTRRDLDIYFKSIRLSRSMRALGKSDRIGSSYVRMRNMHRRGQFNAVCVELLVHAGLRKRGCRTPLPQVATHRCKQA